MNSEAAETQALRALAEVAPPHAGAAAEPRKPNTMRFYNIGKANEEVVRLEKLLGVGPSPRFFRVKDSNARIVELERLVAARSSNQSSGAAPTIGFAAPDAPVAVPVSHSPASAAVRLPRACLAQLAARVFSFEISRPNEMTHAELARAVEDAAVRAGLRLPGMDAKPAATVGGAQTLAHKSIRQDMVNATVKDFCRK